MKGTGVAPGERISAIRSPYDPSYFNATASSDGAHSVNRSEKSVFG
jgi:hypothetical protein